MSMSWVNFAAGGDLGRGRLRGSAAVTGHAEPSGSDARAAAIP